MSRREELTEKQMGKAGKWKLTDVCTLVVPTSPSKEQTEILNWFSSYC